VGPARVLYICDLNAHGGTQTHLLQMLAGLDRSRYAPAVGALTLSDDLRRKLTALDVPFTDMALRGAFKASTLRSLVSLGNLARRQRVDLLHGFLYQGNIVTSAVSQLGGAPYVTSVRNMDRWKTTLQRQVSRLAHAGASRIIFNAEATREETIATESIRRERTVVIRNGVDVPERDRPPAPPDRAPTAACVASLSSKKGHAVLLDAFSIARKSLPQARLLLAGDGSLRDRLAWRARENGLEQAVEFLGHRDNVRGVFEAADVVVLTSVEEGLPNALLEAMAHGLPVVATDVGGNREVVEHEATGLLVPPADRDAVAQALVRLLSDRNLAARMGEAGRERVRQQFGLRTMLDAYMRLYDDVLRRGRRSRT